MHINETSFKTLIIHVTCINIYMLLYDGFNKSVGFCYLFQKINIWQCACLVFIHAISVCIFICACSIKETV